VFNAGRGTQASPLWARIPTALTALALVMVLLLSNGCSRLQAPVAGRPELLTAPASGLSQGRLQEVAPPQAAAAVAERLAEHSPQVEILAPADDSLLNEGPWTLAMQVSDWPLADAGSLGLGPHLVVQIDQQEPLRITSAEAAAELLLPELPPGSHRVTVYAARPWGEAVKSPGAMRQIRLHRVGRNAAELPTRGSAQLIVASPDGLQQQEPVLIDWLLLDAPLQHLRNDDARWRLRVSVNGDSFLVDRQMPLWLKGFRRGSNAVQLELLDGRGEALNPPFNSLVREVVIGSGQRPAWLGTALSGDDLALLSGEPVVAPALPVPATVAAEPAEAPPPASEASLAAQEPTAAPISAADTADAAPRAEAGSEAAADTERSLEPAAEAAASGAPTEEAEPEPSPGLPAPSAEEPNASPVAEPEGPASTPPAPAPPAAEPAAEPAAAATAAPPQPTSSDAPQPAAEAAPQERLSAASSLSGSARDQVNADGSLLQPKGRGPLAGLREKLGG